MGIQVAPRPLLFREFEDGTVCFDTVTGHTCLLSSLAAFLLQACAAAPGALDRHALLEQVLATDDSDTSPDVASTLIDEALAELRRVGLIELEPAG